MKSRNRRILWTSPLLLVALPGCGGQAIYGNLYDGLRAREALVHPETAARPGRGDPVPYAQYERERRELLGSEKAESK